MTDERNAGAAAGLLCPNCRVDLVMSERQGVEIDYCPRCRGVWLDRGELDKILERSAAELGAAAQGAASSPAASSPPMSSPQTSPPDYRGGDYRRDEYRRDERPRDDHRGYGHGDHKHHKQHRRRSFLEDLFD